MSWRLRLGLGDPEELEDEDERELEEPERLEPEELDPLEDPELEPELLLEVELDRDLVMFKTKEHVIYGQKIYNLRLYFVSDKLHTEVINRY